MARGTPPTMRAWRPSIDLRRLASFVFSHLSRIVVSLLCRIGPKTPIIPTQTLASPATTATALAPPSPPSPELVEDVVAEILLRLPPEEPRCLFRASLVCKPWRRLVTDAAFLCRYRRFHGAPPLLGVFYYDYELHTHGFIPTTTSASPFLQRVFNRRSWCPTDCRHWRPVDCRHGRVLLHNGSRYMVWDTITGDLEDLDEHWPRFPFGYVSPAVLCPVAGCNHSDCHGGPFLVVRVWVSKNCQMIRVFAHMYSSGDGSQITCMSIHEDVAEANLSRGTVVGDGVYFTLQMGVTILKYSFVKHYLSLIDPPEWCDGGISLMSTEDGLLGSAGIRGSSLYLWSRKANAGVEGWVQYGVIDLRALLPVDKPFTKATVTGYAEGVHAIFVSTDVGVYIIELNSGQARKVSGPMTHYHAIPFMRFYTPDRPCGNLP